jgi:MoaA/NifB/PqqE/SkfB family radical SAM enzyme
MKNGENGYNKIANIIPYLLLKMPNTVCRATLTRFSLNYLEELISLVVNFKFKYVTLVPNLFECWLPEDYYKWENFIDKEAIKLMKNISHGEAFDYILTNLTEGVKLLDFQEKQEILESPLSRCGMGMCGIGVSPDGSLHPC